MGKAKIVHFSVAIIVFIAPACSRVRYRRPIFCRPSINIYVDVRHYVKVSILVNYKTKQPSNLA